MMKHCLTNPTEPDWYKIYKIYCHKVVLRVLFIDNNRWEQTANLEEYYNWANDNGIAMNHTIIRTPNENNIGTVSFMFKDVTHAMAFKLLHH